MAANESISPKAPRKLDFFISFNKPDHAVAARLRNWLEEAGYSTFMQAPDFHAGSNFVLKMDEGVKRCRRLLAVLSPAYLAADFPQPEWAAFFAKDPKGKQGLVVGVRIEPCEIEGLLGVIRYIDVAGLTENDTRDKVLREIAELPKARKPAIRRNAAPAFAAPTQPSASAAPLSINVTGDVGHLAGGGMTVNHFHEPVRPKYVVERRDTWISDAQAVQIKDRISDLALFRLQTSGGRLTSGQAFSYTYTDFYNEFDVPRYEALPAERFEQALDWFRQEKGKLTRKLRRLDRPAWRNARYGSIKKAMKKMGREKADYYPEVAVRLKMKPFESLTRLTDKNLGRVYQMALRDAGEHEE